ncbi:hypothetical protein Bca4012_095547 [Brassica carinata]
MNRVTRKPYFRRRQRGRSSHSVIDVWLELASYGFTRKAQFIEINPFFFFFNPFGPKNLSP